jgi:pimeloyl-ACP methyl ester carboxylesterase
MKKLLYLMISILAGCSPAMTSTATPSLEPSAIATPTAKPVPRFEETQCAFEVPKGLQPRCGYLIVPEDRSQPGGRTIRLGVALFKSPNPNAPPDPVIHLIGGPGSSALNHVQAIMDTGGSAILEQRDYILFDQRGTRYSEPYLFCQAYDEYLWDARQQDLSPDEYYAGALPSLESCLEDWRSQGIDLAAYNTAENATDVNDLRLALGYDQVNLYGVSYGSRLALEVMRDFPDGVRSVIIDSVFPPQANLDLEIADIGLHSLQEVFQTCAAKPTCTGKYGDLEMKFFAVVDRLEATPAQVEVYGPYSDQPYRVYVDGDLFIDVTYGSLYSMASIADLPHMIDAVYQGSYDELPDLVGGAIGAPFSTGLYWSDICGEEVPFEISAPEVTEPEAAPAIWWEHFTPQYTFDVCSLWDIPSANARESQAVVSDIPTLILSGHFDPVTPPMYARLTAQTLSNGYLYEFSNMAHGVMRSDPCALQMGLAFLDDPSHAPDSSCMDTLSGVEFH